MFQHLWNKDTFFKSTTLLSGNLVDAWYMSAENELEN